MHNQKIQKTRATTFGKASLLFSPQLVRPYVAPVVTAKTNSYALRVNTYFEVLVYFLFRNADTLL